MARKKSATVLDPSPASPDDDRLGELTSTVDTLSQEVRILREAIDELRELLDWAMKNREASAPDHPFFPITRLPRNPLDENLGSTINRVRPENLPPEGETPLSAPPGELF